MKRWKIVTGVIGMSCGYEEMVMLRNMGSRNHFVFVFFFLMIRRPPRSTQSRSSAASDVYKRQGMGR